MGKRPSSEEVVKVHQYVEFCLLHYKTKSQTMDIIARQADIPLVFTGSIWEELERQNPDFFSAYYTRLALMDQITRFNSLLSVQAKMMQLEEETSSVTEGADLMTTQNGNNGPRQQDEGHSSASQPNTNHDSNKGNRNNKSGVQRRSKQSKKPSTNGPHHS